MLTYSKQNILTSPTLWGIRLLLSSLPGVSSNVCVAQGA